MPTSEFDPGDPEGQAAQLRVDQTPGQAPFGHPTDTNAPLQATSAPTTIAALHTARRRSTAPLTRDQPPTAQPAMAATDATAVASTSASHLRSSPQPSASEVVKANMIV